MEDGKKIEMPGFMVWHAEFAGVFEHLSNEEAGELFRALFHYTRDAEEPEAFQSSVVSIVFDVLKTCVGMNRNGALWTANELKQEVSRRTEQKELLDRTGDGLEHLTKDQRRAFECYFLRAMTMDEIAQEMGKTKGQVRDFLNGGSNKLSKYLQRRF